MPLAKTSLQVVSQLEFPHFVKNATCSSDPIVVGELALQRDEVSKS
jgi:hypothetical protein